MRIVGISDFTVLRNLNSRLLTAARDWDGNLFVADWNLSADGQVREPRTNIYGPASEIDLSIGESGHHFHMTAIRDSEDELLLIAFHLPEERGIARGGFGTGGRVTQMRTSSYNFLASAHGDHF